MKRVLFFIFFFFFFPIFCYAEEIDISSKNAILFQVNDASILYEKNAEEVVSIASLTKIMTAIIAIENISNIDDTLVLIQDDFAGLYEANASVAGFQIGEVVTYRDLLYGLLFPSGADAAQALTRVIGGREKFLFLMNEKTKDLGLSNTQFKNETGLEEVGHYSTVKDVATFFLYALENEIFKSILTAHSYTTSNGRLTFESTLENYQKKYSLKPEYLLGGKTGWTTEAGLCLATFAYQDGISYLLVTAGASGGASHLEDAKKLYDYYIELYEKKEFIKKGELLLELPIKGILNKKFYAPRSVFEYVSKDASIDDIKIEYTGIQKVSLGTEIGTKLGRVKIMYQGKVLDVFDVRLQEPILFPFFFFSIVVFLLIFLFLKIKRCIVRNLKK